MMTSKDDLLRRAARAREIGWPAVLAEDDVEIARSVVIPRESWPAPIKLISLMKSPADRGVGDTVARVIGPIGGDAFKVWYERTLGHSCGCQERQEWLNAAFPYPSSR